MTGLEKSLTCTLLPGKFSHSQRVPNIYNLVFKYWETTWKEIFTNAGSPDSLNVENFLRQDIIICLHNDSEIAGIITSSLFNISADAIYDHPYLRAFPISLIASLRSKGEGLILTGEYLSVKPEFRRNKAGIAISDALIGLLMKVFERTNASISLATTVRPAKVHKIGEKFGWSELGNFTKYGLDCVLLQNSASQLRVHDDPNVNQSVEEFWTKRTDLSCLTSLFKGDELQQDQRIQLNMAA